MLMVMNIGTSQNAEYLWLIDWQSASQQGLSSMPLLRWIWCPFRLTIHIFIKTSWGGNVVAPRSPDVC